MKTAGTRAARLLVAFALVLWLVLGLVPHPRPAEALQGAPAADFSAVRALEDVRAIAQKPHPIGSAEHARVRDYIAGEFTRMGITPEIESGFSDVTIRGFHGAGNVENIVARLPGTANTRPVMLVAHYDSVHRGPGAGDDASGVAVLLETLRALRASRPLRNDVIFLVSDGEEAGLLGAQYFMRHHAWRNEPGVVLNFDARGTGGSAVMFETSAGNEWLVRGLQAAVPQADATSVAYEIYRRMPNDTDLTVFKAGGLAGMNFAFIDHPEYYHRAGDTLDHLDPVSVQEQGRYALSLARWFGNQDLNGRSSGDAVYFPTSFTPLIVYPVAWARVLAILTLLAAVALAWRARGVAIPLVPLAAIGLWLTFVAPGASYLIAWPLVGSLIACALRRTAPPIVGAGWRAAAIGLCAAPGFLLLLPMAPSLIVALTLHGALPILLVAALLLALYLLPQLAFILR